MIGVEITAATMIISPIVGLLVGLIFGLACYFIGRLSMDLDYRYNEKIQNKRTAKMAATQKEAI